MVIDGVSKDQGEESDSVMVGHIIRFVSGKIWGLDVTVENPCGEEDKG